MTADVQKLEQDLQSQKERTELVQLSAEATAFVLARISYSIRLNRSCKMKVTAASKYVSHILDFGWNPES
jgi:hypothetical protein